MGLLPYGADPLNEVGDAHEGRAMESEAGASVEEAIKCPGLYLLVLVAGIFVMCAAFFQQIPAFCAYGELGASAGAVAVSIVMVGGTVAKFFLGWLNDRVGAGVTGVIAAVTGAFGLILAWMAGSNVMLFYIGMGVFGFGYAALTVVAPMLARAAFGSRNYSQIYSWVSTGIFISTAISFTVYGLIYDNTGSYDLCFVVAIALYVIAAILIPFTIRRANVLWKNKSK